MEQDGKVWYVHPAEGRRKKINATNRPQFGRIRYLAVGNEAVCYVLSETPVQIPSYIRLGKFMSKAWLESQRVEYRTLEAKDTSIPFLLNPADLGPETDLKLYDLVTVPPTPLVRNARLSGRFYQLPDGTLLPAGMRFGVDGLP